MFSLIKHSQLNGIVGKFYGNVSQLFVYLTVNVFVLLFFPTVLTKTN